MPLRRHNLRQHRGVDAEQAADGQVRGDEGQPLTKDRSCQPVGDGSWRDSKWLAVGELAIVVSLLIADRFHYVPLSNTPFLFVLACISLGLRKKRWSDLGLRWFRNWRTTLAYGLGIGLALELFQLLVSQPFLVWLTGQQPHLDDFRFLIGRPALLALFIPVIWLLAAFGEEMAHRGYLMNRVADLGNRTRVAWLASLLIVNGLFGICHSYQGITGVIDEGLMGLLLGVVYLACSRNLSVPIIAHGVQDTIDALLIVFGMYPGM
jgi:membrane protease YdiL (CAAX protease family)